LVLSDLLCIMFEEWICCIKYKMCDQY